jgi:uncharacterized membrane protein YciS (DUF1049 family)
MKRIFFLVAGLGLFVAALWLGWSFRAANAQAIDVDLIWFQTSGLELWWSLFLAAGVGGASGAIFVGFAWLRLRLLNRRYRKAIKRLESELHQMRSLPLVSSDEVARAPFAEEPTHAAVGRG